MSEDGKAAIEFTGAIPIGVRHPVTGNPLLYAVRFDMLATYNNAMFCVDEKTTTQLGQRWAGQWDLDSQFTGYVWGGRIYGYPVVGAIIRGIGLLKTKISHAQSIVYRPDWMVERWYNQLCRDAERMIACWREQYFDFALDKSACDSYSGCPFKLLCESPQPDAWIETYYENHVWDPLHKDGDAM